MEGLLTFQGAKLAVLVLNALHGLVLFYDRDNEELNVDGLFGLRVMEGQLKEIWLQFEKSPTMPPEMLAEIKNLSEVSGRLANRALPFVFNEDQEYFKRFKYLVHKPYSIRQNHKLTDPKVLWPLDLPTPPDISEETSDRCIGELLAAAEKRESAKTRADSIPPDGFCNITEDCMKIMLDQIGLESYAFTHQILYTSVAETTECTKPLDEFLRNLKRFRRDGLEGWRKEWCSNLLNQMNGLAYTAMGRKTPISQYSEMEKDLFMEQIFTCGQFGYQEFVRRDWLDHILSWQDTSGCWKGSKSDEEEGEEEADAQNIEKETNSQGKTKDSPNKDGKILYRKLLAVPPGSRRLLVEKIATDNCAGHASAVATGALTIFLRFLLDPGPKEWSHLRVDLQKGAKAVLKTAGLFRRISIDKWKLAPDSRIDIVEEFAKPPADGYRDWTMFFSMTLIILFLCVFWRLSCRRKRNAQMYPFSFKKL